MAICPTFPGLLRRYLAKYSGPVTFEEALQRSLPRLGKGNLPLDFLLDTLKEAGFEGPVIFELTIQEARASLEYLRPFLAERWQLSCPWSLGTCPVRQVQGPRTRGSTTTGPNLA